MKSSPKQEAEADLITKIDDQIENVRCHQEDEANAQNILNDLKGRTVRAKLHLADLYLELEELDNT